MDNFVHKTPPKESERPMQPKTSAAACLITVEGNLNYVLELTAFFIRISELHGAAQFSEKGFDT
jgi:hypothetical protein